MAKYRQGSAGEKGRFDFLQSSSGRAIGIGLFILGICAVVWSIWSSIKPDQAIIDANTPLFIDAETGQSFHVTLKVGMEIPVTSPFTGRNTGYRAELCYWTKDGQPKSDPTPVLLNSLVGKPEPTFCPDCGRLVVGRNPMPGPGVKPPPTKAEYMAAGQR